MLAHTLLVFVDRGVAVRACDKSFGKKPSQKQRGATSQTMRNLSRRNLHAPRAQNE
jgi:hypothetical protein